MLTYCVPILLVITSIFATKLKECQELSTDPNISEQEELFRHLQTEKDTNQNQRFKLIFPGTRWCGEGDIAKDEEDLGYFKDTDSCCREHDHCSDVIMVGETRHNYTNNGPFTRLSCSCDDQFYRCLLSKCSPIAAAVGITYFDVMRSNCFIYDYPANCIGKERDEIFGKRCTEYQVDEDQPKIWQWREPKKFDLSKTSEYFMECFKNVTLDAMKTTNEQITKFVFKYGIEPLIKICKILSPNSWYRKYFCPQNVTFSNDLDN